MTSLGSSGAQIIATIAEMACHRSTTSAVITLKRSRSAPPIKPYTLHNLTPRHSENIKSP